MKVARLIAVLALLVAGFTASPAQAAGGSDAQMRAAIQRVAAGTYSPADMALVRSDPQIAASVPDGKAPPTITSGSEDATPLTANRESVVALATACKSYWVNYYYKSALGSTIYQWQKYVTACYNGSTVTSIQDRYDWLPQRQTMVNMRERTIDTQSGVNTWTYNSRIERHLEYCVVKYGCYADTYPWAQFKVYGNGTWWYTGANS